MESVFETGIQEELRLHGFDASVVPLPKKVSLLGASGSL